MNDEQRRGGIPLLTGSLVGLARLVHGGVIAPAKRHICRRACKRALMQMDDHLLRDIGLTRSEVDAIAHGLFTLADATARATPGRLRAIAPRDRQKRKQSATEELS